MEKKESLNKLFQVYKKTKKLKDKTLKKLIISSLGNFIICNLFTTIFLSGLSFLSTAYATLAFIIITMIFVPFAATNCFSKLFHRKEKKEIYKILLDTKKEGWYDIKDLREIYSIYNSVPEEMQNFYKYSALKELYEYVDLDENYLKYLFQKYQIEKKNYTTYNELIEILNKNKELGEEYRKIIINILISKFNKEEFFNNKEKIIDYIEDNIEEIKYKEELANKIEEIIEKFNRSKKIDNKFKELRKAKNIKIENFEENLMIKQI